MTLQKIDNLPNKETVKFFLQSFLGAKHIDPRRLVDKPLVLYGAGNLGKMAKTYFDRIGIKVEAVIDKNMDVHQQDLFWEGIPLFSAEQVGSEIKQDALLAVCIANGIFAELYQLLKTQSWHDVIHFYDIAEAYRDKHPLSNGWFGRPLTAEQVKRISNVLIRWRDDESRAYHLQFLAWRLLRSDWVFHGAPIQLTNRYFIPEVMAVLTKKEVFVDIGGHVGETTQLFLEKVKGEYKHIHVFECDTNNFNALEHNLSSFQEMKKNKISLYPIALAEAKKERQIFDGAGYASQFSTIGNTTVKTDYLDSFNIRATFIKLHLEGAELEVLKGAEQTIIRQRPVIVMTAYHNDLGMYKMPEWLMETLSDYEFIYRLHSGCGTGAVIYAIPKERFKKRI